MNPFQAFMGRFMPQQMTQNPAGQQAMNPVAMLQGAMQQAQQLAMQYQNPQALVQNFFPDAPAEIQGDPDRLAQWIQQSGKVSPQIVQMARSMMGR